MRDFLRFLFTEADQIRIDVSTIQVEDVAYSAAPAANTPYPQSLRLTFKLNSSSSGPLELRPLFPGRLSFIADSTAAGITPEPDAVEFTSAAYATWKIRGTLMVKALPKTIQAIKDLTTGLEIIPNAIWYSPIKITEDFLFTTLRNGLTKTRITATGGTSTIQTSNPNWAKHAVARFLAGQYEPQLRLKTNAADDDVVAHPMPAVHVDTNGQVSLIISTALIRKPQDARNSEFDNLAPTVAQTDPAHPRHGAVPARRVYRLLRPHMLDANVGSTLPDKILAQWPDAPRYFPLRFTRTWLPIENCSFLFPANVAQVTDTSGSQLFEQRLPAHGILYVTQSPPIPPQAAPAPPQIRVSVTGGLRTLDGATANSWRIKAGQAPLTFDFAATPIPHIIARRRMTDEILVERRYTPGGARCTFLSMRRSVRALIDHRITGGRLNFSPTKTGATTQSLMRQAWSGTQASPNLVANNRPNPNASPGAARRSFLPILEAFFPNIAPAQNIGGSTHRVQEFTEGRVAYELWQTTESVLFAEGTKRNFSDAHVARGAPGSLVAVDLAANFHVDPVQNSGETDNAYFDRIVSAMITGLEPGAVLQFWTLSADYENLKSRTSGPTNIGHSPIFLRYDHDASGSVTGMVVIDQFGETNCPIIGTANNRRITWGNSREIWIAANWDE